MSICGQNHLYEQYTNIPTEIYVNQRRLHYVLIIICSSHWLAVPPGYYIISTFYKCFGRRKYNVLRQKPNIYYKSPQFWQNRSSEIIVSLSWHKQSRNDKPGKRHVLLFFFKELELNLCNLMSQNMNYIGKACRNVVKIF